MALTGIKVVELAGLAPAPFAGLVLSDFGADVIRVDRTHNQSPDLLCRGKRSLAVDLKSVEGKRVLRAIIDQADVLIDPFRPQVLEKLELGPDTFLADGRGSNQSLIYARVVG
jgi:alpha-methylacyl-CoA racemase